MQTENNLIISFFYIYLFIHVCAAYAAENKRIIFMIEPDICWLLIRNRQTFLCLNFENATKTNSITGTNAGLDQMILCFANKWARESEGMIWIAMDEANMQATLHRQQYDNQLISIFQESHTENKKNIYSLLNNELIIISR